MFNAHCTFGLRIISFRELIRVIQGKLLFFKAVKFLLGMSTDKPANSLCGRLNYKYLAELAIY